MIITVTLNPCIDLLMSVPSFTRGGMNRVSSSRRDICGKGINVSAALKNLGEESLCTGFNYSGNASLITDFLNEIKVPHDFVCAEGSVRTNIKLVEEDTGTMTEINQPGEYIPPAKSDELAQKIAAYGKTSSYEDILIISGSRPKGVNANIFNTLTIGWHGRAFLDMEGEAFMSALDANHTPYLVKPNLYELETAFKTKLSSRNEIKYLCRKELCGRGIEIVCVSMGGDGAMLITRDESYYAPALSVPVRGLAGAGDSMVAGFAFGFINGASVKETFRMASAAAAASVIREGTQMCLKEDFDDMLNKIEIL